MVSNIIDQSCLSGVLSVKGGRSYAGLIPGTDSGCLRRYAVPPVPGDAEDAVQETFLKYLQKAPVFSDLEHEKAWLLTVASNKCRDLLRFRTRHPNVSMEFLAEQSVPPRDGAILDALMEVPEKFRLILILHYVEGYSTAEIARIIGRTGSAVKMRLQKGRKLLEEIYRKEYL